VYLCFGEAGAGLTVDVLVRQGEHGVP